VPAYYGAWSFVFTCCCIPLTWVTKFLMWAISNVQACCRFPSPSLCHVSATCDMCAYHTWHAKQFPITCTSSEFYKWILLWFMQKVYWLCTKMFVVGTLYDLKPLSQYIVCQPWLSSSVDCLGYVGGHEWQIVKRKLPNIHNTTTQFWFSCIRTSIICCILR